MRISVFVLACIAMAIAVGCWAQIADGEVKVPVAKLLCKEDAGEYLTGHVPVEYAKLTAALAIGKDKDIVDALLPLIDEARALYENGILEGNTSIGLMDYEVTYLYTWVTAVDVYGKLTDQVEQNRVLVKWDQLLTVDRNNVRLIRTEIDSLFLVWNKDFQTERFISIFQESTHPEIIQAYNYYFMKNGGVKELELLTAKQKQLDAWYEMLRQQIGSARQQINERERK